jgi:hypothetical protein
MGCVASEAFKQRCLDHTRRHNEIGDGGLKSICNALTTSLTSLEALYLNDNNICCANDSAVDALASAVARVTTLETLWLHKNLIIEIVVARLPDALRRTAPCNTATSIAYVALAGLRVKPQRTLDEVKGAQEPVIPPAEEGGADLQVDAQSGQADPAAGLIITVSAAQGAGEAPGQPPGDIQTPPVDQSPASLKSQG